MIRAAPKLLLLDKPNERSSHIAETPRAGGVGLLVAIPLAGAVLSPPANSLPWLLIASCFGVGLLGFADDLLDLSPLTRLPLQIAIALFIAFQAVTAPNLGLISIGTVLAAAIGIAFFTNLFNFMDGIDGLAATEGLFVSLSLGLFLKLGGFEHWAALCFLVAAGTLAFLIFNWPPARIFMGDVGSTLLGFYFAAIAAVVCLSGEFPFSVWLILTSGFWVDAIFTLARRALAGERLFSAHRSHAYQRLAVSWKSHGKVTLAYSAVNVFWLLPLAFLAWRYQSLGYAILFLATTPIFIAAAAIEAKNKAR